ncbi:glycerate kinase type-2 family protein [Natronobacterium gregoryi]|uniref:DUF4147 domain-containing protein n=2 Tax=Natronobacterium gregoryi TaxID=44930 RepID=L0AKG6_NATGS|nr:DUF4147 domain-containing protein [Natronobacterium gregoryi]AFZ74291.1 putative glycerate kinase [Natronobacterium gregoryi SP2]ELY63751.1 hydroxypyruvate reductase [Natronobacterium gregoryi SP2]PLK22200.1 DUF4147 domain-containing protein [Natronobacterium gregoryi SP2]SFI53097.1 hydroxypyruvate reductase [Natronobacterium gregoryi]
MVALTPDCREAVDDSRTKQVALECLLAGIETAHPEVRVEETISLREETLEIDGAEYDLETYDDVVLVGAGNAAGQFAAALEDLLRPSLTAGAVVTDDPVETEVVDVLSGDHPVPSDEGVRNARTVLECAREANEGDLVLACFTGGGSALLAAPAGPLTVSDLQAVTEALLACGASIDEINAVRKHCSAIKGGQLARAAAPATVVTVALSDVVGDDLSVIASGPTVPDSSTYADALSVVDRYDLSVPDSVRELLRAGVDGDRAETPTVSDPVFESGRTHAHVLGNGRTALEAASDAASKHGYNPLVLSSRVRGESREAALTHVAIAEECREHGTPLEPPAVVLSGGETTVTLGNQYGRGGPNQEFVLASALALENDGIVVSAVDTDGIDGTTDVAGAIADATTIPEKAGRDALDRHDATSVLESADAVVRTGPTGTNVNDLRVIVIDGDRSE